MDPRLAFAARFAALGGSTAGLALAPVARSVDPTLAIAVAVVAAGALTAARPRRPGELWRSMSEGWTPSARVPRSGAWMWLLLIALAAATAGLGVGAARLAAIDGGAANLPERGQVRVTGFLDAVPRRDGGEVRLLVETAAGGLMVEASEPVPDLPVGSEVVATGTSRDPGDWERPYLERLGVRDVLRASRLDPTGARRDGLAGVLDGIRERAEGALGRGTSAAAASLLRGFVLGQDDRIDSETVEEFKASGLAHLLAVSGQNVVLLGLLAGAVLALLGVRRRARLVTILALIALYVPVAGAGPSIQRAGVMGAAGLVAALASRPRSRWYAVMAAAAVTLALNPRASADVGWQLSFAAVAGILASAGPIQALLAGGGRRRSPLRRAVAEGAALTVAATIATAPLMAHHFGTVSLAALPANLIALPAVAPVMWLGMLAAAAGQLPWLPVEPLISVAGALAGFIAQVGEWLAVPGWAQLEVEFGGLSVLAVAYVALAVASWVTLRAVARRRALRPALELCGSRPSSRARIRKVPERILIGAVVTLALAGPMLVGGADFPGPAGDTTRAPGLRVTVLDVGQGDAILLDPRAGDPVLVDAGPPSAGVAERLSELGVERLAALAITHPQADHAGGAAAVLDRVEVGRLLEGIPDGGAGAAARAAGAPAVRIAAGDVIRLGRLRLEVLWPPRELLAGGASDDPNRVSLALVARWRRFDILLGGDAEAELAPVDPGPVEVLKVAHHGSADPGLPALLERTDPELAVISVGDPNPYGHPAPQTLADLATGGTPVLRTDRDGEVTIDVGRSRWTVR